MTPEAEKRIAEIAAEYFAVPTNFIEAKLAIRTALADPILTAEIRAEERERCAKICDDATNNLTRFKNYVGADETRACAAAIRAIKD